MFSPHGSYFMILSLTNEWAKGDFFFDFAMMDHCILFFTMTFTGRKIHSVFMLLLVCCSRIIHQRLTPNILAC